MAEESIRDFLRRREREIATALTALLLERADVRSSMAAIGMEPEIDEETEIAPIRQTIKTHIDNEHQELVNDLMRQRPGKVLILESIKEKFPNGVTSPELRDYLRERWDRRMSVGQVSVYLSHLKNDGNVGLEGRRWYLKDQRRGEK